MVAPPATWGWRIFGCKKKEAELAPGVVQAGRLGPTGPGPSRPGLFAPSLPWVLMYLCTLPPSTCTILTMSSSHPRWRFSLHEVWSFTLQSSGMFLCNTSVLGTFGSDFIKLRNTNGTPKLFLWTCCNSILYVHVFLQKHNTSKCTHEDELVIWLVCLVVG
jgi:hypothetical protein